MFGLRKQEHRLIAETPITLLALTRHEVEPSEEQWFARCRADFMRSFPIFLQEIVRLAMLFAIIGPASTFAFREFAIGGWSAVSFAQVSVQILEREAGFDDRLALRFRTGIVRLRALWWCGAVYWALVIAPASAREALIALAIAMMVIDSISTVTLPFQSLLGGVLAATALMLGLIRSEGWAAAPMAAVVVLMLSSLHWTIFNYYYMFATRRIRTRRLSQSNETIRLLLNQYDDEGSDWLYETDASGCIRNPSTRFCTAAGLLPEVIEGLRLTELLREDAAKRDLAERLNRREPFRALTVSLLVGDEERWWSISGRPVMTQDGVPEGWRGFIADITETRRAEARVAWLAHYDALTGLANRTLFQANLERLLDQRRDSESVALLYIDLDLFKEINDSLGHAAGDAVLTEVARRLEQSVRPRDLVARLGGDEFVVLAAGADTAAAEVIAERILAALSVPIDLQAQTLHDQSATIGASIGLAVAPIDGDSTDELLRAADLAMYHAKAAGRCGIAVYDPSMHHEMRERRELELDLRAAIRRGQLELHYQALLDIASGRTIGYEALLRWQHPERGQIPPGLFIPIAEDTGLIGEIGEWVLRKALDDAAGWPEDICVAVNLSPVQIRDAALVPVIINALAATGVDPRRLELEITESVLMQESADVLAALHRLRALGVRIALDDFGTGYSSLNYLRTFPFDKIKIDRCFVSELAHREDCQAIVRSVLALASELNMVTIAEGVEMPEQLTALLASGCNQAQGFLFARAVPADQLDHAPQEKRQGKSATVSSLPRADGTPAPTPSARTEGKAARRAGK